LIIRQEGEPSINSQDIKIAVKSLSELSDIRNDFNNSIKNTAQNAAKTQKLWRVGNKSKLMSIGMAVFLFPEPTPISEIVGVGMMAAGAIQQGIKNQGIYMEDIPKTLKKTLKVLSEIKYDFRM